MIKFLDLHKINDRFREELKRSFDASLDTSHYILGHNVSKFEEEFAQYCGATHCIGTANGLDALTLILKGYIQIGRLKKGDKIIVPANTFIATILSVLHAGLEPVLVEPNPNTYNISPKAIETVFTNDVKAIIAVHLYGQLADMEALQNIATTYNLLLVEDAAQAHGGSANLNIQSPRAEKRNAGNLGDAAAFSFYPTKNLGALGDAGAVTTNNSHLAEAVKLLRNYGSKEKYRNELVGFNSRLDDMQAAFLNIKLKYLDTDNERRRGVAKQYLQGINNPKLKLPFYDGSKNHVFYAFVVEVEDRKRFMEYLIDRNVESLIHYPIPPHKQDALKQFSNLSLPLTEQIHKRILSLPISPVMTNKEVETVVKVVNAY